MSFFETSARTGHNVNEAFTHISKLIMEKIIKTSPNGSMSQKVNGVSKDGYTVGN